MTPGEAKDWTYILERRSPDGWVAFGDMRFFDTQFLNRPYLDSPFDVSITALLSGLRMDLLKACEATSVYAYKALSPRKPLEIAKPSWPEDPSNWAKATLDEATTRLKRPKTFVCGREYNGIGPSLKHTPRWAAAMNACQGHPSLLLEADLLLPRDMDAFSPRITYASRLTTAFTTLKTRSAHQKMAEAAIAQTLTDEVRAILIETKRAL